MINRKSVVIKSVEPMQGHEGTIVTIKGSGFDVFNPVRNNCVVVGGMGACARALPESTDTELKVRIGPVARAQEGDILMWPGVGAELHTGRLDFGNARLTFSETAIFRNGAPVASANVKFKLTKASPDTYGGEVAGAGNARAQLGGQEGGSALRVSFPKDLALSGHKTVDVCIVLKEPTLAIDFTAELAGADKGIEEALRAIAKSIAVNADLIGARVLADVVRNDKTGGFDLYVTKPYLTNGMAAVHFS